MDNSFHEKKIDYQDEKDFTSFIIIKQIWKSRGVLGGMVTGALPPSHSWSITFGVPWGFKGLQFKNLSPLEVSTPPWTTDEKVRKKLQLKYKQRVKGSDRQTIEENEKEGYIKISSKIKRLNFYPFEGKCYVRD